jgi:hypothetical protein
MAFLLFFAGSSVSLLGFEYQAETRRELLNRLELILRVCLKIFLSLAYLCRKNKKISGRVSTYCRSIPLNLKTAVDAQS